MKKQNNPKYFNLANLSKLIENLKTNDLLNSRKNPGEIQAFVKSLKLESGELVKMNNERILPKNLKKNNIRLSVPLKLETTNPNTNIKQLTIVTNGRAKEKPFSQVPL